MVKLLEENDVEIRLSTPIQEIEIENGRTVGVRAEDGTFISASMVVANADPTSVYQKLVGKKWRSRHSNASLNRRRQSMSLYVGYFGTKKKYDDIKHHTIILGPRYKGLLKDIFHKRTLADDFSLYLHRPTASDPSLAPAGHDAFYVLSPVPNNKSGIDWEKEGAAYHETILNSIEKTHLPGLRENLVTDFFVDPRYFAGELRSVDGAAFGLEPVFRQSAWFRFHNRSEDVEGLYFVGAGTHPGAGMPGVLCSAKVLEKIIPRPDVVTPNRKKAA